MTFLLTGTQQISYQQKQELPDLLLKLLACVFVGSVTFLHCILRVKQNQFLHCPWAKIGELNLFIENIFFKINILYYLKPLVFKTLFGYLNFFFFLKHFLSRIFSLLERKHISVPPVIFMSTSSASHRNT